MAEIRFNYGDKFTQTTDTNTGIGSTIPAAKLDIVGGTSAGSLRVSGIATLSSYQGFVNTKLTPTEDLIVEAGNSGSVSGEVVVSTGQTISVSTGATTGQGGIQSLKVYETFMPPVGGTADRPTDVKPGMVYYNKDFKTIEFWDGNFWKQVDNTTTRGRGVVAGGGSDGGTDFAAMTFVTVSSLGNSLNFGDLTTGNRYGGGSASNSTRGLVMGGWNGPANDFDIDYITIASEGNGIDFGENTTGGWGAQGASDSVRAICAGGGYPTASATIDMFFFSTVGSKTDFGDIKATKFRGDRAACSQVRGIFTGGYGPISNTLDTKLLASSADTTEFGTLAVGERGMTCVSDHTRGVITGWYGNPSANLKNMDFLTITSTGTMTFFGDLTVGRGSPASIQNMVRGIFAGGRVSPTLVNTMDFITISSAGDAQDFGDLTLRTGVNQAMGMSDSHGGLGGF